MPPALAGAVRSYRTFSPLPPRASGGWRFVFCGTFRGLAPPRRYLAPCPVEPGLSSAPKPHDAAIARPAPDRIVSVAGRRRCKGQSFPTWYESGRVGCFQRGMSLNGSRWVDHGSHGDRHERDATVRAGAAQGFSGGTRNPVPVRQDDEGATRTSRRCSSALPTLGSSGRTRGWCCAIWVARRAIRRQQLTRHGSGSAWPQEGLPSATVRRHRALPERRGPMWRFGRDRRPATTRSRDPPPST